MGNRLTGKKRKRSVDILDDIPHILSPILNAPESQNFQNEFDSNSRMGIDYSRINPNYITLSLVLIHLMVILFIYFLQKELFKIKPVVTCIIHLMNLNQI